MSLQSRVETPEYELPLCSSTPLKPEAATVVGMSPKPERAGAAPAAGGEAAAPRERLRLNTDRLQGGAAEDQVGDTVYWFDFYRHGN